MRRFFLASPLAVALSLAAACGCPLRQAAVRDLACVYVTDANASIARDATLDEASRRIRQQSGAELLSILETTCEADR